MRHYHPNLLRQCLLLAAGLALAGLGVALTTRAGLGTSPISSLPYVFTFLTPLTFGAATFAVNLLFVLAQALLLGRAFPAVQYGQLGVVLLFGLFIDLGMWVGGLWVPTAYWGRMAEVLLGSVVLAAGIALQIHADLLFNPGEGLVKALCRVTRARFAWTKLGFDVSLVLLALALSLAALHTIRGLREGTLVAAFAVGLSLRWLVPLLRPARRWLFG